MATNYGKKYELKPDCVLTNEELLQIDRRTSGFVRTDTGEPPSLEDVQLLLSTVLLIPKVPDSVKETLRLAKRLHLFGYFEYGFFTISQHYGFLALEAALHSRWALTLPNPVSIQLPPNAPIEFQSPTHERLFDYWKVNRKLKVNGVDFPNSVEKVIGQLQAKGIVTPQETDRIKAAMYLRNTFSHLEFAPIDMPRIDTLHIIAELINNLFDRANPNVKHQIDTLVIRQ